MNSKRKKFQHGVSNIQIMITVLIGVIMITGGIQMIGMIDEAKADSHIEDLADYKKKIVSMGAAAGTFPDNLTETYLYTMGVFDSSIASKTLPFIVSNRWGGKITARSSHTPATITPIGKNDAFTFSYTGIPAAACKHLATEAASIADIITVEKTTVKRTIKGGGTGLTDEPLAISKCESAKDNVTMTFLITKD